MKVKWVSQLSQFLSKYAFLEAPSSYSQPHTILQNLDMYLKVLGNVVSQLGPLPIPPKLALFLREGGRMGTGWAESPLHLRSGRRIGSGDSASHVASTVGYSLGRARETGNRDCEGA